MDRIRKICNRCVMDTSAENITFSNEGICNYCTDFLDRFEPDCKKDAAFRDEELQRFVKQIKDFGRGKPYDCIVGVSGGVDSSWVLVNTVRLGLRPLAVHMDNGWNSELAQHNIASLVRHLNVDLFTYVVDWEEYRQLMQAFFDADVIDVELLYDNAMLAVNYQQAAKYGIKFILSGTNQATEGMRIPANWNWFKFDSKNIKALGEKEGQVKLKTFPRIGTLEYIYYEYLLGIHWVSFLDFLDYKKFDALHTLQQKYSYKPYPYKHYESIFTRFYQGYLLPQKFGVDKRRLHLSNLIMSSQLTREEALEDLKNIAYSSEEALEQDKVYFLKKMKWTPEQLKNYLQRPEKPHDSYPSEKVLWDFCRNALFRLNKIRGKIQHQKSF